MLVESGRWCGSDAGDSDRISLAISDPRPELATGVGNSITKAPHWLERKLARWMEEA